MSSAQWGIKAYTLAFGGLALLGGRIADYNRWKKSFVIGLLGFAAASAVGGAATDATIIGLVRTTHERPVDGIASV